MNHQLGHSVTARMGQWYTQGRITVITQFMEHLISQLPWVFSVDSVQNYKMAMQAANLQDIYLAISI